jgi:hypothetical protein
MMDAYLIVISKMHRVGKLCIVTRFQLPNTDRFQQVEDYDVKTRVRVF